MKWPESLRGDILVFLSGSLLTLAFAPFDLFPLAVLAPALLFLSLHGLPSAAALRRGFFFGLGLFATGISWVYVAIADFSDTGSLIAVLLTALFAAALAIYPALFAWLASRIAPPGRMPCSIWYLLVLPILWLLLEWLRGNLFTGFTWLQLGYSQTDSPLRHWAAITGVYGMSFMLAFSAGALAWLLHQGVRALPGLVLAALFWGGGWALQEPRWTIPVGTPVRVALIQDNLPQSTKWDAEEFDRRLNLYAELTLENLGKTDVVIWPENAVTLFYQELKEGYFDWLAEQAAGTDTEVIISAPILHSNGRGYYTSLMLLGNENAVYHKRHLVPFGEFVPFESLLRGLVDFFDLPMSSFSAGAADQAPLPVAGQRAAMSICYEDAFGEELLYNFPLATLLINGSNNAWYGDSLALHQHLQIARMRSLETGRPLVRATTTGISALIDHRGQVFARSEKFTRSVLHGEVQPMQGMTPYARWGNRPVVVLMFAGMALMLMLRRRGSGPVIHRHDGL